MMDCKKAEKLLVEYLYQELSPERTLEIEKHLETCDACAKTLENWRGIHRGFQRSNDVPQPAPFLKTRLMAAAREELERKPSFSERLFAVLKPAFILPILIFGILVLLFLPQKNAQIAKEMPAPPAAAPATEATPRTETPGRPALQEPKMAELKQQEPVAVEKRKTAADDEEIDRMKEQVTPGAGRDQAPPMQLKKEAAGGPATYAETSKDVKSQMEQRPSEVAPEQQPAKMDADKLGYSQNTAVSAPAPAPAAPAAAQGTLLGKSGEKGSAESNFQKAQVYFKNNDLPQGKNAAEEAIRTDSAKSLAVQFHDAGRQYQAQNQPQQAIVQYNLVLNNYPGYPGSADVLLRLAESYEQIGDYNNAVRSYQQLARVTNMKKTAEERLRQLSKKQQVQEQLRSLGYTDKNKDQH